MKSKFSFFVRSTITFTFLVIIAGGVVRMTGSGMGCPDWPKCFGYYIPPSQPSEIEFQQNHNYQKGQMILVKNALYKANESFISTTELDMTNWTLFEEHDYAIYNPTHTYIEYINRLFGALLGFSALLLVVSSFKNGRKNIFLSLFVLFMIAFEGWLGALVVESVLSPVKITLHMLTAFFILMTLMYLLYQFSDKTIEAGKKIKWLSIAIIVLTLIQVLMGTQVREFIDEIALTTSRDSWLSNPNIWFYIHRTFSLILLGITIFMFLKLKKISEQKEISWILAIMVFSTATGIIMYYFGVPAIMQPVHLVLSAFLISLEMNLFLKLR
jgi:cytochrome c oxidase assembly protein subunit 15